MSELPRELPSLRQAASRPAPIPDRPAPPGQPIPIPEPDPDVQSEVGPEDSGAALDGSATPPGPPQPSLEDVIAGERAEAARLMALGPIPNPAMTVEALANNPSDFRPEEHPAVDEGAINLGAEQLAQRNASVLTAQARPAVAPAAVDTDERQLWVCVHTNGLRTEHPVFRSDAHLLSVMVHCPTCDGISVRKVEPGETLAGGQ